MHVLPVTEEGPCDGPVLIILIGGEFFAGIRPTPQARELGIFSDSCEEIDNANGKLVLQSMRVYGSALLAEAAAVIFDEAKIQRIER